MQCRLSAAMLNIDDAKKALAGGLAGSFATAVLHPVDTVKVYIQIERRREHTGHHHRPSLGDTLRTMRAIRKEKGIGALYSGFLPSVLGALPSSALYFGAYELVKSRATSVLEARRRRLSGEGGCQNGPLPVQQRAFVNALAAASGNAVSAMVFVPKEFVKQQLQASKSGAIGAGQILSSVDILWAAVKESGIKGVYRGYRATLVRNVPSSVLRFSVFEELKRLIVSTCVTPSSQLPSFSLRSAAYLPVYLFLAGAVAGAVSSGLTTPMDNVKTNIATRQLSQDMSIGQNLRTLWKEQGMSSLLAGMKTRVLYSGLFSAVGLGSFEAFKSALRVSDSRPLSLPRLRVWLAGFAEPLSVLDRRKAHTTMRGN
ncbi:unnamed protein product [Vitrella brassicaformis CCMP3155]|uniref:Mitochondrial carrier protein n=1 Tax=Vitrella brassicaformis (strain CCMP3155) TaxID=1169540 RepID=A0A0G4EWL4_VITBC|nr:unnamed protein product [Vitrella brassicaformis CCMP3155]|eukprot:CEM02746.1 unnamed protein product [Vitrella brassicaformis CCMP3155]